MASTVFRRFFVAVLDRLVGDAIGIVGNIVVGHQGGSETQVVGCR